LALNVRGAHPGATANELRLLCTDNTRASQRAIFGDRCWAEWRAYAQCSLSRTDYCPCELDGGSFCVFTPEDHDFGLSIPAAPGSVSCEAGAAAVARCAIATGGAGTEKGPGGAYDWVDGEFGCSVRGAAKGGVDWIESSCVGSVGGLQQCTCRVNGVDLVDHVGVLTGENPEILAADCRAVALALAAGRCADVLDCCYQYTQGQDQLCSCSAHPEHAGFASCKDLAASLNGSVYGVCDAYRPPPRP
jgi:hypothetical protein